MKADEVSAPVLLSCTMHGGRISPDDLDSVQTGTGTGVCGRCISEKLFPLAKKHSRDDNTERREAKRPEPRMKK